MRGYHGDIPTAGTSVARSVAPTSANACPPNWRSADDYADLRRLDRAGWAWEWMRRNPEYQRYHEARL